MALQPMALYERVIHPAALGDIGRGRSIPIPNLIKPGRDSKRVYVELPHIGLDPAVEVFGLDQIGPQIPPFPEMWIEARIPSGKHDGLRVSETTFGALIRDQGVPNGETRCDVKTHVTVDLFSVRAGGPVAFGLGLVIIVRTDGSIEEYFATHVNGFPVPKWEEATSSSEDSMAGSWALPALTAVGLMNCRNVTTERHERPVGRNKKQRRQRPPKLDYHTIILPGSKHPSGATSDHLDVMPQHKVRGHFKTYTAEAPLLGMHVGTYWWGWNVRGNKRNGITVTDYALT